MAPGLLFRPSSGTCPRTISVRGWDVSGHLLRPRATACTSISTTAPSDSARVAYWLAPDYNWNEILRGAQFFQIKSVYS